MGEANLEHQMFTIASGWNLKLRAAAALSGIKEENEELLRSGKELCKEVLEIAQALKRGEEVRMNFGLTRILQKDLPAYTKKMEDAKRVIENLLEKKSVSGEEKTTAIDTFNSFIRKLSEDLRDAEEKTTQFMRV
jgi:MoaA/NifB/PqqE/SkfB family radical SAM enzyme